jgi:glycosyltransferase involved in cell wall biosynthesis
MSEAGPGRRIRVVVYDEGAQGASQLGGGQIARINLLAALDRSTFRPILLTSRDGELAAAARARGVEVVVRDINGGCPRAKRDELVRRPLLLLRVLWSVLGAARRLAHALDELDADVLHPNENLSRVVALMAKRRRPTPTVIHIDNEWNRGPADRIMRFLFLRGFDRLIAVSERAVAAADPAGRFRAKTDLIPTGLDPAPYRGHDRAAARAAMGVGEELVIATVGRLEALKGQAQGLEAIALLRQSHGDAARYVLIGEGPDRPSLEARARALGLGGVVIFLGHRTDVPRLLPGVDILLHASLSESLGLAVIEALHAGVAVVATRTGAAESILDGGRFGRLVAPGDVPAMAAALAEFATMTPGQISAFVAAGSAHAASRYSEMETVRCTANVYREMVGWSSA